MKWKDKLTEVQRRHLRESGARSLAGFKRNRTFQKALLSSGSEWQEPCRECRSIAETLGLEEVPTP